MIVKKVSIPDDVLEYLRRCQVDGCKLFLPPGQLERDFYVRVDKILKLIGGKWSKLMKCHIFPSPVAEIFEGALDAGEVVDEKQTFQFFPTPEEVVDELMIHASIGVQHTVLEPSAGEGAIIRAIYNRPFDEIPVGENITLIEIHAERCAGLKNEFPCSEVKCVDFLEWRSLKRFDRIVMNPPFTKGTDAKHIKHALSMLKIGGRLVSVVPGRGGATLKAHLETNGYQWQVYPLPAGSFKAAGTGIETSILVVDSI